MTITIVPVNVYEVHICSREKSIAFYKLHVHTSFYKTVSKSFFKELIDQAVGMPQKLYLHVQVNDTTKSYFQDTTTGKYYTCDFTPVEDMPFLYNFDSADHKQKFYEQVKKLLNPPAVRIDDNRIQRLKSMYTKEECTQHVEDFMKWWGDAQKNDPFFEEKKTAVVRREYLKVFLYGEYWKDDHDGTPREWVDLWLKTTGALEKYML